ncbi:MAG TPA: hybrid sensor histidine kinase/response regulator, partial [Kofleriaceae bacterium]|nr:hybrid sensor histidine kinase/response regulator [Kofleriaceae bacterium]
DADAIAEAWRAMHEIVDLHRELARQKARLEESNKAVRILHVELEQYADRMRSAAEIKGRLVAGVSHEFRTPLHSILGLSRLLLGESDGPLTEEQRTQVAFIRASAEELSTMINDMLDLARLESETAPARIQRFDLAELLSAMRGTMTPLVPADSPVSLVFDPAPDAALETDQAKLAQIVRNLISNAIKFTERGVVRITATVEHDTLQIAVRDSGIGIADADRERVFQEFVQVDSPLQRERRGTGLGLPLAARLARSLGGQIELESEPGVGSTFTVVVPMVHSEVDNFRRLQLAARTPDPTRAPVLVVEDDRSAVFVYERYLAMSGYQVLPARSTGEASAILKTVTPSAILLDVMLEGEDTWKFLASVKQNPATRDIPVLVCTVMNREAHARALGADEFWLKPVDADKLIRKLHSLVTGRGARVLVVDDEPAARYLVKKHLSDSAFVLSEAADGASAVHLAREERPDVILLDFLLRDMTAFDVLDQLKADPRTRQIPVIVVTSQQLSADELQRLAQSTQTVLSKEHLSRELAIHRIRDALRGAGVREPVARKP